jgi:hypothetical protein
MGFLGGLINNIETGVVKVFTQNPRTTLKEAANGIRQAWDTPNQSKNPWVRAFAWSPLTVPVGLLLNAGREAAPPSTTKFVPMTQIPTSLAPKDPKDPKDPSPDPQADIAIIEAQRQAKLPK